MTECDLRGDEPAGGRAVAVPEPMHGQELTPEHVGVGRMLEAPEAAVTISGPAQVPADPRAASLPDLGRARVVARTGGPATSRFGTKGAGRVPTVVWAMRPSSAAAPANRSQWTPIEANRRPSRAAPARVRRRLQPSLPGARSIPAPPLTCGFFSGAASPSVPYAWQRHHLERCESGRIGLTANEVTFTGPRVQIPPSPLAGRAAFGPARGLRLCRVSSTGCDQQAVDGETVVDRGGTACRCPAPHRTASPRWGVWDCSASGGAGPGHGAPGAATDRAPCEAGTSRVIVG